MSQDIQEQEDRDKYKCVQSSALRKNNLMAMKQIREPQINSGLWSVIYNQQGKNIPWGEYDIFNKWCWTVTCKRIKFD